MSTLKLQLESHETVDTRSHCLRSVPERLVHDPASPSILYKIMTGKIMNDTYYTPPSSPESCQSPKRAAGELTLPGSPTSSMADLSPVDHKTLRALDLRKDHFFRGSQNGQVGPFDEIATDAVEDAFFSYDDDDDDEDFEHSGEHGFSAEGDAELVGLAFVVDT